MRASWLRRAVARALFFFSMATHFEGSPGISPPEECTACVTNASSISASPLLSYPPASDRSTSLVRELLRPFSLENFALEYFEKGPLVIRGRWVYRVVFLVPGQYLSTNSSTLFTSYTVLYCCPHYTVVHITLMIVPPSLPQLLTVFEELRSLVILYRYYLIHTYSSLIALRCVCVCVFFLFILDIKFVGRTSRGHTGGRSHRISHPPSFCGACLNFSRDKDPAIPFPRRL